MALNRRGREQWTFDPRNRLTLPAAAAGRRGYLVAGNTLVGVADGTAV